jgi:hypothetical protein
MSLPPNRNIFSEFKGESKVFIETGSYRGDGIQAAIDAGFKKIISIDSSIEAIEFCVNRFDLMNIHEPDISLIHSDSAISLYDIIKDIKEPILFWLDAHWQFLEGTEPGKNPFPLLKELDQISKHKRNDHTIIIDDFHIFYPDRVGYSKKDI